MAVLSSKHLAEIEDTLRTNAYRCGTAGPLCWTGLQGVSPDDVELLIAEVKHLWGLIRQETFFPETRFGQECTNA